MDNVTISKLDFDSISNYNHFYRLIAVNTVWTTVHTVMTLMIPVENGECY